MVRKPAVAGTFYPADSSGISELVAKFMGNVNLGNNAVTNCKAFVTPHAGHIYSGQVAAYTYSALLQSHKKDRFDSFLIIGPNHTGYGKPIALSLEDWETPLGVVRNDIELSKTLLDLSPEISGDETAHAYEHSIEVQLPFMQETIKGARCVFICMGDQSYDASVSLSETVLKAAKLKRRRVAVIASSDFNHYESAEIAKRKDAPVIDALKSLDAKAFHDAIRENKDSACGYGPITVAALFAQKSEALHGTLLKYANSGDITHDYRSVVAYASFVFS